MAGKQMVTHVVCRDPNGLHVADIQRAKLLSTGDHAWIVTGRITETAHIIADVFFSLREAEKYMQAYGLTTRRCKTPV